MAPIMGELNAYRKNTSALTMIIISNIEKAGELLNKKHISYFFNSTATSNCPFALTTIGTSTLPVYPWKATSVYLPGGT